MRCFLFLCLMLPFLGKAQTHQHTAIAPAHTFQLIIPSAKFLEMYDVVMTDSMLEVIELKRQPAKNVTLPLNLGMSVLILSKTKVEQGIRIPKIEIIRHHH